VSETQPETVKFVFKFRHIYFQGQTYKTK